MSSKPVLLLFGYGPRTGKPIADKFLKAGYRVAAAGRSLEDGPVDESFLNIKADLADPNVVPEVYNKTSAYFKAAPNVVVFNAYSITQATAGPLSLSLSQVENDLRVNILSLYVAGAEAVKGFESLSEEVSKTFIFVGNKQSHGFIYPPMVSLGMGKAAAAYMIGSSAAEYSKKGFNFYYVDERQQNGEAIFGAIDGNAHGEYLLQLTEDRKQGPWEATFVKGKGHVRFPELGKL